MKTSYSIDEILELLPHRYPFLLIDRVEDVNEERIVAYKNITANEPCFTGHFPGYPVFPGVLIIEAMAQVSGIFAKTKMLSDGETVGIKTYFTSIDGVKFKKPVRPGDKLVLECTFVKRKMGIWWFDCKAMVDGSVVCVALLSATFQA